MTAAAPPPILDAYPMLVPASNIGKAAPIDAIIKILRARVGPPLITPPPDPMAIAILLFLDTESNNTSIQSIK